MGKVFGRGARIGWVYLSRGIPLWVPWGEAGYAEGINPPRVQVDPRRNSMCDQGGWIRRGINVDVDG